VPRERIYVFHVLSGIRAGTILNIINPLNAELNPICFLLALLGAHHILHVGRIRVNKVPLGRGSMCFVGSRKLICKYYLKQLTLKKQYQVTIILL
jgi:hypothetical protein